MHMHGYNFKKSQLYDSDYSQFLEEITWYYLYKYDLEFN